MRIGPPAIPSGLHLHRAEALFLLPQFLDLPRARLFEPAVVDEAHDLLQLTAVQEVAVPAINPSRDRERHSGQQAAEEEARTDEVAFSLLPLLAIPAEMTDDQLAYSREAMKRHGIVDSGDALALGIGAMTDARWHDFFATMTKVGVFKPALDYRRAYTLAFVNKKVGMK